MPHDRAFASILIARDFVQSKLSVGCQKLSGCYISAPQIGHRAPFPEAKVVMLKVFLDKVAYRIITFEEGLFFQTSSAEDVSMLLCSFIATPLWTDWKA